LAEETNLSQKQFERQFERVVGMMPKRYVRLARFQKLVGWLRRRDSTESWAALAARFGYYDHSHLVKDFQAFAGTTPSEFTAATAGIVEVAYGNQVEHQEV
jgi:AraC-like DNA-binding protein